MWIIPNNLSSAHALVCEDWREESLIGARLGQSFMWRSKRLPLKTWLSKWSKVWWLQHLFGRILRPSMEDLFVARYTGSLAAPTRTAPAPVLPAIVIHCPGQLIHPAQLAPLPLRAHTRRVLVIPGGRRRPVDRRCQIWTASVPALFRPILACIALLQPFGPRQHLLRILSRLYRRWSRPIDLCCQILPVLAPHLAGRWPGLPVFVCARPWRRPVLLHLRAERRPALLEYIS